MDLPLQIRRLAPGDEPLAQELFRLFADVFDEPNQPLSDAYLVSLLRRPDFWAVAAFAGTQLAGGLTAHTLPMTRSEQSELLIYDLAVRPEFQRQGIGRAIVTHVLNAAATAFVLADDEDTHALDFYRAIGGEPSPVTLFLFRGTLPDPAP